MRGDFQTDWNELIVENKSNGLARAPLTIRTIDEILCMTFDEVDLILQNGYLTAGDIQRYAALAASANLNTI